MPIEPLAETEMLHAIVVGKKLNELIEAFNNHYHRQADYGMQDYDKGMRTSMFRLDKEEEWPSRPNL